MEEKKADLLIQNFGKKTALIISKELVNELSDLPRIPYNERRENFWRKVKDIIEKK